MLPERVLRRDRGESMKKEFKSKVEMLLQEINESRPLKREQLKQLKDYFRIGLTYSSNALEGNTLTEVETKVVIEEGITVAGKPLKDHLEAIGHAKAYDYIYSLSNKEGFSENDIKKLHRLFYAQIDNDKAGRYRKVQVYITGTEFLPPEPQKVATLMKEFISEIPAQKEKLHPVDFASWLHLELATIHPFVDGNGRTARLLLNLALFQTGYPVVIIPPVLRKDYLVSIINAQLKGYKEGFYNFIAEVVIESLKDYKRLLRLE